MTKYDAIITLKSKEAQSLQGADTAEVVRSKVKTQTLKKRFVAK